MIDPRTKRAHDLWLQLSEAEQSSVTLTMKKGPQINGVVGDTSVDVTTQHRDPEYIVILYDARTGEELTINMLEVEAIEPRAV